MPDFADQLSAWRIADSEASVKRSTPSSLPVKLSFCASQPASQRSQTSHCHTPGACLERPELLQRNVYPECSFDCSLLSLFLPSLLISPPAFLSPTLFIKMFHVVRPESLIQENSKKFKKQQLEKSKPKNESQIETSKNRKT